MSKVDKRRFEAIITELKKVAEELKLPEDILEDTIDFLKSLHQKGFIRGRSFPKIAFACLFYKIKRHPSCPAITFRDYTKVVPYPPYMVKEIRRFYNKICAEEGIPPQICTLRPTIYVKALGEKMGLSKAPLEKAIALAKEAVKKRVFQGKWPLIVAAACLYTVGISEGRTQKEVAEACGITEGALRNRLKHPFFAEKIPEYEKYLAIGEKVISKLTLKLLIDLKEIPFRQVRLNLRRHFPDELKGFTIPDERLWRAIRELEQKGQIRCVPGLTCLVPGPKGAGFDCHQCRDFHFCHEFSIAIPKETQSSPNSTF